MECSDQAKTVRALAEAEIKEEKIKAMVAQEKQAILREERRLAEFKAMSRWAKLFPWRLVRMDSLANFKSREDKIEYHVRQIEKLGVPVAQEFGCFIVRRM